jgi:hypothetical protein
MALVYTILALNTRVVEETRSILFALMFGRLPFVLGRDETEVGLSLEDAVQRYKKFWITFQRNVVRASHSKYQRSQVYKKTAEFKVGDHVMYQARFK